MKVLNDDGLAHLWSKMKGTFVPKSSSGTLNIDASVVNVNGASYITCATSGYEPNKEVIIDNFSLYDGVKVRIKFEYANTSLAPFLVINGDYDNAKSITMSGVVAGKVYIFVYDETSGWKPDANSGTDTAPYLSVTSTGVKIINQTKSLEDNDVLTKADVDRQQYLSLLDTYIIDCGGAV